MLSGKKNPELEIGRNSSLYFAMGLNLMLFFSWQALEYKTYEKNEVDIGVITMEAQPEEEIPIVNYNPPPPAAVPVAISENIQIVDDIKEVEETVMISSETDQSEAISNYKGEVGGVGVSDVKVAVIEEDVDVPFAVIEDVPVFPGCEGLSKSKTKECFQKKIQEHVIKNFNYPETAMELGIQGRVSVVFIIDSKGNTSGIRSRGPDKILEKEAERIIGLLPKMQPGKQRGRPVRVAYAVPIYFKYEQ
ncbi:energy transducer TonB [Mariniflexile sp. HNIBRBA6329]|uniref:energy transducer TonB n=1 Tax=Mariniflexile sp. HNIBRBA6329 TaxID=3373088 RepID=UPI003744D72D